MEPATNRRNQFRQQLAGDLATTQSLLENGFPSKYGSIAWSTMISSPSWIPAPTIDQPDTRKMKVAIAEGVENPILYGFYPSAGPLYREISELELHSHLSLKSPAACG